MGKDAILEEYADVLGDHPEFVAEIVASFPVFYPLTELSVIRHALAANAEFILTVNMAPRALRSEAVSSGKRARSGEFLNVPEAGRTEEAHSRLIRRRSGERFCVIAWARQGSASPLRALDPPGALPVIAITGATGFRTTLCRLTDWR